MRSRNSTLNKSPGPNTPTTPVRSAAESFRDKGNVTCC